MIIYLFASERVRPSIHLDSCAPCTSHFSETVGLHTGRRPYIRILTLSQWGNVRSFFALKLPWPALSMLLSMQLFILSYFCAPCIRLTSSKPLAWVQKSVPCIRTYAKSMTVRVVTSRTNFTSFLSFLTCFLLLFVVMQALRHVE